MKKIILAVIIIIFEFSLVNSEEKANPISFNLSATSKAEYNTVGAIPKINHGWAAMYFTEDIIGSMSIPIKDIYTLKPWIEDYFEVYSNYNADYSLQFYPSNGLVLAMDNTFSIPNALNIGVNFQSRYYTYILGDAPGGGLEVRLSPIITLGGSYDIGLSWGLTQMFNFYLYPNYGIPKDQFAMFETEGTYTIGFDFMHFLKKDGISGGFNAILYLDVQSQTNSMVSTGVSFITQSGNVIDDLNPEFGFSFNLMGLTTYMNYYMHFTGIKNGYGLNPGEKDLAWQGWHGFKTGVGYTKDWFTAGINYVGRFQFMGNESARYENHVSVFATFAL